MSLWKKAENVYTKYILGVSEDGNELSVKIPYNKIIFSPWIQLYKHIKSFFYISFPFVFFVSIISSLLGMSYVCRYNNGFEIASTHCSTKLEIYIVNMIIYIIACGFFAQIWKNELEGKQFCWRKEKTQYKTVVKFVLLSLAFLLINMIPVISLFILYIRNPNPDWRIEIAFFAVVSLGFLTPFVCMRFYALFSYVFEKRTPPQLWMIWQRSKGNLIRIIISLFVIIIGMLFCFNSLYYNYAKLFEEMKNNWFASMVAEFIYNFFCFGFFCVFFNLCQLQRQYFSFPKEEK